MALEGSDKDKLTHMTQTFLEMEDNKHHWIGEWGSSTVREVIARDFVNQSKAGVLSRCNIIIGCEQ